MQMPMELGLLPHPYSHPFMFYGLRAVPFKASNPQRFKTTPSTLKSYKTGGFVYTV